MARIKPFQPYRYSSKAGELQDLVTQPYDKISPKMQREYLARSPYNLVRVILGPRDDGDDDSNNVYTRAARYFEEWIAGGILWKEAELSIYAYSQEFQVPDSGETLIRRGFIALGAVEEYETGVVHRHEQTLSGPKKDRRQVLEHTKAHFGQIFMIYPDAEGSVDALIAGALSADPTARVTDEYGVQHSLYKISDPGVIAQVTERMADKQLIIADGHHRYETALAYRNDHPESEDAKWVMMTFVNMNSRGLRILATHRVLKGLAQFNLDTFLQRAEGAFEVSRYDSVAALKQTWEQPAPDRIRIGMVVRGVDRVIMLERDRAGDLDVRVLHEGILQGLLDISPEAVRDEQYIQYVRGVENAADMVTNGRAQVAFLLEPTTVEQVAATSFGGGCMPQKSTDFYPKLLTGLTIYKLEH
jgi:uncharacterized protein (DUF1015 family)